MFNNNQVLGALQKNTFRTLSSCDHKIFCSWKMVTDKRLVGCWYRYWHYWVGLSINSLASIAIFLLWRKLVASERRGRKSAASMLLFRSPDGGTLSMLASPQLPLTNQRYTFHGKNISAFHLIFRFRMFSKKCASSQEEARNRREVRNEEDSCRSWPSWAPWRSQSPGSSWPPWSILVTRTFDQIVPHTLTFQTNKSWADFW